MEQQLNAYFSGKLRERKNKHESGKIFFSETERGHVFRRNTDTLEMQMIHVSLRNTNGNLFPSEMAVMSLAIAVLKVSLISTIGTSAPSICHQLPKLNLMLHRLH